MLQRYCVFFSGSCVVELEPDAEPVSLDVLPDVLPAPAEPLGELLELDGVELEDEPPLAWSFFWMSTEVDEELEPEPEGAALDDGAPAAELEEEPGVALGELVVPEPDIELDEEPGVVAPEPDGEVVDEDDEEPAGAREALSDLLQPARNAPPNASETARARVESFMWPPWLGYLKEAARIGPRMLRNHPAAWDFHSVLHRRRGVRALWTGGIAAAPEVAVLVLVLRIDLPLLGVRALALLCARGSRRCRGGSGRGRRRPRRGVGFR